MNTVFQLESDSRDPKSYVARADHVTLDEYRAHMVRLCGNVQLPAIVYKGEVIPSRVL